MVPASGIDYSLLLAESRTAAHDLLDKATDIALLQESYPDITPVSGILATTFSTPPESQRGFA